MLVGEGDTLKRLPHKGRYTIYNIIYWDYIRTGKAVLRAGGERGLPVATGQDAQNCKYSVPTPSQCFLSI